MIETKALVKEQERMREVRAIEEPAMRDIARILRPDEQNFNANENINRDTYDVFDSTPLHALNEFASGLFTEATNPVDRWLELEIEDKDLQAWGPVRDWLWGEASLVLNSFSPNVSGFYPAMQGVFANVGAFGNAFEYQEEWLGRQRIIDINVPIGQCFFDCDIGGDLNKFNREYRQRGSQVKAEIGDKAKDLKDDRTYTIVHAVYENPQYQPGKLGDAGKRFTSTYFSPDDLNFRADRGYYEMPYHPFFWDKRTGRPWAVGPGHNARADMNMNNEIARANMVDAQFAAEPMVLTQKEGAFTAADILPNNILDGGINAEGKKMVDYLQRGDNSARAEAKAQQVREAIKEAWMFSLMQIKNRPQMTATEFMGWKSERLRLLSPNLVRTQQGLAFVVSRRYGLLQRAGQTRPMPPELQGHNVAVKFVSPLAKAQELATGQAVMQWVGMLGQIAKESGDTSVFDVLNKDNASRVLHRAMVGLPEVINDPDQVGKIRQQRADFEQQQMKLENAAKTAGVVADVSHATQAMSLSKTRSGQAAA